MRYIEIAYKISLEKCYNIFRVRREDVPILVISPERLKFLIFDTNFENSLPVHLNNSKDFLVVGCTVGLRYSDLISLKKQNLQFRGEATYLYCKAQKTGFETVIKLPDYVQKIFNKRIKCKTLLHPISNHRLNINLKKLCALAGWDEPVAKFRNKEGRQKQFFKNGKPYKFSDLVTTHIMRRTAITTLLTMGLDEILVRRISGHSDNSISFYRYVKYSQNYIDTKIDLVYAKLTSK
ncbi:MAG: tyrosine-type recombinase/integrase [Chitinophagales bacterium]